MNNSLDLNKKFPNYFNKLIFRLCVLTIVLLFAITIYLFGVNQKVSISCNDKTPCVNPLYKCSHPPQTFSADFLALENTCDILLKYNWSTAEKNKLQLQPGEVIGEPPPFIIKHLTTLVFIIIFLSFGINHLFYLRRKKP